MKSEYIKFMRRCLSLAKKGEGRVSPNPLVGAVIFDDNFNIISEGFHQKYGENHAERNAILNTNENLKDKSIVVNLEPCSHYGKTPPCADLIIERGIKRVIAGMQDPNPKVSGRGFEKLRAAGIEVITGVLESECRELNRVFIKNQVRDMPYTVIKTAMTMDAKISAFDNSSKWITDEISRRYVHKLRNRYDAVLTSSSTVIADNPLMTCRINGGRNPVRIVLDTNLKTNPKSAIYDNSTADVIIICSENISQQRIKEHGANAEYIKCPEKNKHIDLTQAVKEIYKTGIKSIMIEAGGYLNNSFIEEKLVDEIVIFMAPKILADKDGKNFVYGRNGISISECNNLKIVSTKILKNDIIINGRFFNYPETVK